MLVLALQFSRCDVTHAELEIELDAAASEAVVFDSFKTEEKTVTAGDVARGEGPYPCDPRGRWPTAHQCTNWVCLTLGRSFDDLQWRSTP